MYKRQGINSQRELDSAITTLSMAGATQHPNNLLLEQMITPAIAEMLVNISNDPEFGHILTLGSGGIFVELIKDTESLLLPASRHEIIQTLDKLRISKVLRGYRNQQRASIELIITFIVSIFEFADAFGASFQELELNPVIISNTGPVVADAVLRADSSNQPKKKHYTTGIR